jgi:hypothetical protein
MKDATNIVKFENRADIEFDVPGKRCTDPAEARKYLLDAISKIPDGALRSVVGFRLTVLA